MESVNTIITGSNANVFFGTDSSPLGSLTLGATLRFIALKHHQGDIETIKPIKVMTNQFSEYNNVTIMHSKPKTTVLNSIFYPRRVAHNCLPLTKMVGLRWILLPILSPRFLQRHRKLAFMLIPS